MSEEIVTRRVTRAGAGITQLPQVILATEAPVKKPETPTKSKATPEPTYKVILHNDSSNPMEHVVQSLQQVIPKMTQEKAVTIMLEAHTKGKAVAKRCHKELAEMYEEGLRSRGLIATIEPD
ncbi:ATP-dependent Clp protease adaptor ClpS [Rubrobacter aplysinae]|uniref:ATP-dependent Clp protease adaptor ClpS n=1 Tax=Rubrobacter aplysinae TaxID=909625 RepID=UPI000A0194EA|nr:ATP-dependent Clp protease adaptor ClpS [Rubrobacter aplysinae]